MSGRDLLLEYAFPIEAIEPIAEASAAYLNQVLVVAKPKAGQEGNVGEIYECLTMAAVSARTDNANAQQLFNAGMDKVFILLADDLDLQEPLETFNDAFTVLISDDFDKDDMQSVQAFLKKAQMTFTAVTAGSDGNDISIEFLDTGTAGAETVTVTGTAPVRKISVSIEDGVSTATQIKTAIDASEDATALILATIEDGEGSTAQAAFAEDNLENGAAIEFGTWGGIIGVSSDNLEFLENQAVITKRTAFFGNSTNKAKNMFFAFGKLLSGRDWENQQYIEMPFDDGINTQAEAENLYDNKISFVLSSEEFGKRLSLFTNNRKAIIAPYIFEWFQLSLQSWGVQYIALNQPKYTLREASLLQDYLEEKAEERFVATEIVEFLSVKITLVEDNFMANGDVVISEPKALWRVTAKIQQGLI
jgi:hypothetical protein